MQIGFVGLGKMGGNMALRLAVGSTDGRVQGTHRVVGYARDPNPALEGVGGVEVCDSLAEMVRRLEPPRAVWVMVPAGKATEAVITELAELLSSAAGTGGGGGGGGGGGAGIIIDGGNSYYKDTVRRAENLAARGIGFLDVGTSGGVWGRSEGYCMMVGGAVQTVAQLKPIFDTLAPPDGWAHVGPSGAGHFVKMIHNGIEYGLMQAYAEGFEILRHSKFAPNLHQVAHVWNRGSVVRSWLLELSEQMLAEDPTLTRIQPYVEDSGEGRWTVEAAIEENVAAPVIAASLFARFESRDDENYAARFCAALRKQFGGHDVVYKEVTTRTAPDQQELNRNGSTQPPSSSQH